MTGTIWPKRRKGSLGIPDCPREWPTSFTLTLAAWAQLVAVALRVAWALRVAAALLAALAWPVVQAWLPQVALAQSVLQVQRAPGH